MSVGRNRRHVRGSRPTSEILPKYQPRSIGADTPKPENDGLLPPPRRGKVSLNERAMLRSHCCGPHHEAAIMNRQQSMKKCAAIKKAHPLGERRKVERMGRMIHKAEAEWKRSPEFAAQWAEAERTRRVS